MAVLKVDIEREISKLEQLDSELVSAVFMGGEYGKPQKSFKREARGREIEEDFPRPNNVCSCEYSQSQCPPG